MAKTPMGGELHDNRSQAVHNVRKGFQHFQQGLAFFSGKINRNTKKEGENDNLQDIAFDQGCDGVGRNDGQDDFADGGRFADIDFTCRLQSET